MDYTIGKSDKMDPYEVLDEITEGFEKPILILYFTPVEIFKEFSEILSVKYPDSVCMGATTRIAITKSWVNESGSVAVAFESGISCSAGILKNINKYPIKYASEVKRALNEIDETENTICFELSTGLMGGEESVLSTLNSVLHKEKIKVVGGSAGNISGDTTYVSLNGRILDNSAVFVLIHNKYGAIHYFRENIYEPMNDNKIIATDVDLKKRIVREYNHRPAIDVYAEELGVPVENIEEQLDKHPVGRFVGNRMFITANKSITEDRGIQYHSRIYNNTRLSVLKPADYREVNEETFDKIKEEVPEPSFTILVHCLARTELFLNDGYMKEYSKKFGAELGSYIGFSGYGEQYSRYNFNMTAIIIVFE
ncbi:MAG: FIST C-terminal domain-containing protein [Lachnospiraceae bacterium]|nr:FIST C-terminal domain-containing protein [Lachnospiraceae bacterium]